MKDVSKMNAEELDRALQDVLKGYEPTPIMQEPALNSQGSFKKFSLYEDFDIGYAVNATIR